jgi:hypothetical protein
VFSCSPVPSGLLPLLEGRSCHAATASSGPLGETSSALLFFNQCTWHLCFMHGFLKILYNLLTMQ